MTKILLTVLCAVAGVLWLWIALIALLDSSIDWNDGVSPQIEYVTGSAGQVLLPASVNGIDLGLCLLDSGAEPKMMAITPSAANRAGLSTSRLLPWSRVNGSYGSTGLVPNRVADEFAVGPLILRDVRLAEIAELAGTAPEDEAKRIGGICSSAIFQSSVIDIDWRAGTASLYKPDNLPADLETAPWIPLVEEDGMAYVSITVEDNHDGLFLIDTGQTSAIHFYVSAVDDSDLLAGRAVRSQVRHGIGGSGIVSVGQVTSLTLSNYRVGPVAASFDTMERYRKERKFSGRIGIDLLRHFRIIMDMQAERVAFITYDVARE